MNSQLQLLSYFTWILHGKQLFYVDDGIKLYNHFLNDTFIHDNIQKDAEEYFRISADKVEQLD